MTPDVVVQLARETLMTALLLATPILAVATVVSLLINIAQVMTSIQEHTVATVPQDRGGGHHHLCHVAVDVAQVDELHRAVVCRLPSLPGIRREE